MNCHLLPIVCLFSFALSTAGVFGESSDTTSIRRTNNRSPVFYVAEDDVRFFMNYTGMTYAKGGGGAGKRMFSAGIDPKVLNMIDSSDQVLLMSVFLFDSFYSKGDGQRDLVTPLVEGFLSRREANPKIKIAVILDPSHRAYGKRKSPAEKIFWENGIDVFYSDLLSGLNRASPVGAREAMGHLNRVVDRVTFRRWGYFWTELFSRTRVPKVFDGEPVSLESIYNALLLKANHRKLLVGDVRSRGYEAMITSANPHSASGFHVNTAVAVRGGPARYVYNLLREDMMHCVKLGRLYTHWHNDADRAYRKRYFIDQFPALPLDVGGGFVRTEERSVGVTIVTENEIPKAVISLLDGVEAADNVRIQMFYLSFQPVLDAIIRASMVVDHPIRLLLDANKDSFNKEKDGTPNRQVARYLLREAKKNGGKLEIRWYSTHGEQNHAKIMSITHETTAKNQLTTGSCNWTGRNMAGVNMESNVVVDGASKVNAAFNKLFDRFWSNQDGVEYSLEYEVFKEAALDRKWRRGEKPFYLDTF